MPVWALFGAAVLIVLAVNAIGQKLHRMSKASSVEASAALDLPPTPRVAVAAAESAPTAPVTEPVRPESLSSARPAPSGDTPAESALPRALAQSPPPPPAQPAPPARVVESDGAAAERRFAQTWVNVRSRRSGNAPVVRILKPGEPVKVDLLQAGWYRVVAEREQGYVDGRYLDTSPPAALP